VADFQAAFDRTLKHEGGYADIPDDRGGETYRGISRKWNKDWPGWDIIDDLKKSYTGPHFNSALSRNKSLTESVRDFYEQEYWKQLRCSEIDSQVIANEIFDTAVLMGKSWAIRFLQRGMNALNRTGATYSDIKVDGRIGAKTLQILKECLSHNNEGLLLKIMDGLQLGRFIKIMDKDPSQEQFARGWIKHRIQIGKI